MAVELSSDELAKVTNARVTPRPNYYDAASLQDRQISEDFEAFLILQDPAVIEETLTWLTSAGDIAERRVDRNSVAFEALVVDIEDRQARQDEVSGLTSEFSDWRAAFQAGKFNATSEVGLLIRDCMATAEEVFVLEERLKHLENMQLRVADTIRSSVSNAQLNELLSWPTPLLSY